MLARTGRLVALIVAITVVPLSVLLFLGWRVLEQDRILEARQAEQNVQRAADLLVGAMQRAITESEERLIAGVRDWPEGAVALTIRGDRIDSYPRGRLAYVPLAPPLREAPAEVFAAGEVLEFAKHDPMAAIEIYRRLAQSTDRAIQAGALLRLGRNLDAAGRPHEAFDAYNTLANIDDVAINAVPAALVGRYARCEMFEREKRSTELREEGNRLLIDLRQGRWLLSAPVYFLYSRDAVRWAGRASDSHAAEAFSEALQTLWERRQTLTQSGQEAVGQGSVALWQRGDGVIRILIAGSSFVASQWVAPAELVASVQHMSLEIDSSSVERSTLSTTRNSRETNLPWNVTITAKDPADHFGNFFRRRRLMIAGFALLAALSAVAGYVIIRAVNRELAVARLQTDFVAAVSHEFRTPLTALRQFTDLLRKNEIEAPTEGQERRLVCYDVQSRATERLTRLVESLLDFGRMEAGVHRYEFAEHDCSELVSRVVDDFQHEVTADGYDVKFHRNGSLPAHVDREALSRALRNLLDNAVKYSPDGRRAVDVSLARNGSHIRIAVRDCGIGIPVNERTVIFSKFHRGEQARKRGIKGTGIGLAMVDEIVRAHQGRVELESEVEKGSTFTIVLPVGD